jgi:very-short-patch-repair endonuclease
MSADQPVREPNERLGAGERAVEQAISVRAPDHPIPRSIWAPEHVRGRGDGEVARIAALQRGFIHRRQLLAAGLSRSAIAHRLGQRRLFAYHRDVYLVGRRTLEPLGREMAAVLHLDGFALLSHRSAAAIWGLIDPDHGGVEAVQLTLVGRDRHSGSEIRFHRVASVAPADIRCRSRLPVTSPARCVVDLAGSGSQLELENAVAECRRRGLASDREIRSALGRNPRATGAKRLLELIDSGRAALTRSVAERRLLELIRAAELPQPLANAAVCGHVVDLFWPEQRLIVEFDGWETHGRRTSFETDRRRDQRLVAAGYRVIRITWRQLQHEPLAVIARLAAALV